MGWILIAVSAHCFIFVAAIDALSKRASEISIQQQILG
jgi:hypothetical protein